MTNFAPLAFLAPAPRIVSEILAPVPGPARILNRSDSRVEVRADARTLGIFPSTHLAIAAACAHNKIRTVSRLTPDAPATGHVPVGR
jgi:hypothetical protein